MSSASSVLRCAPHLCAVRNAQPRVLWWLGIEVGTTGGLVFEPDEANNLFECLSLLATTGRSPSVYTSSMPRRPGGAGSWIAPTRGWVIIEWRTTLGWPLFATPSLPSVPHMIPIGTLVVNLRENKCTGDVPLSSPSSVE